MEIHLFDSPLSSFDNTPHSHGMNEIILVLSGAGSITVDGASYQVCAGDVVCIPAGTLHQDRAATPRRNGLILFPNSSNVNDEQVTIPRFTIFQDSGGLFARLFRLGIKMQNAAQLSAVKEERPLWSLGEGFFHLLQEHNCTSGKNDAASLVNRAILQNFSNPDFSLPEVIEKTGYSHSHLRRIYKLEFGLPPLAHLNQVRIHYARALIESGESSISEIGFRSGFRDPYYFSRMFRQMEGLSPMEALTAAEECSRKEAPIQ